MSGWTNIVHSWSEYLGDERFDQPPTKVEKRLIVAATPRTGSNLLASWMVETGVGLPMEYFGEWALANLPERWGANQMFGYQIELQRRRTVNGIFSLKTVNPYELDQALELPDPKVVWLRRRDRGAQAKSYALAFARRYFCDLGDPDDRPEIDVQVTDDEVNYRSRQIDHWESTIISMLTPDLLIWFEDIIDDGLKALNDVRALVDLDPVDELPETPVRKIPYAVSR